MPRLTVIVTTLAVLLIVFCSASTARSQCSFSFSAAPGPAYHQITYTISGQTNGTVSIYIKDHNGVWQYGGFVVGPGNYPLGGLAHNQFVELKAVGYQNCESFASATAPNPDGYPWVGLDWTNAGIQVYSDMVPPDMSTTVFWSQDNLQSFGAITPEFWGPGYRTIFAGLSANVTYFFYAQIQVGSELRTSDLEAIRLAADQDYGNNSCGSKKTFRYSSPLPNGPSMVGEPVSVVTGNMYLDQTDFMLPGIGESIEVTRSYNSLNQTSGMFGLGWTTEYDQRLDLLDARTLRLQGADGRGIYFAKTGTAPVFKGFTPGFPETISANGDGTYTLNLLDGRTRKFSSTGKLLWLRTVMETRPR